DDQGVEEHENGRRPTHQAYAVGPPEVGTRHRQEIISFALGVVLLGGEPAREWLLVVQKNFAAQRANPPAHHNAMGMTLVAIGGAFPAVENHAWRIQGPA